MALKFGTSGVRGLVTEMTDRECFLYTAAFARYLKKQGYTGKVFVAGDLRSSTPRIKRAVVTALASEGLEPWDCGAVPTPAVTYLGITQKVASIMVTGSHIPEDRNGIKFNMPHGEVLKSDEKEISAIYQQLKSENAFADLFEEGGSFREGKVLPPSGETAAAEEEYIARYTGFFPEGALKGMKVVFYEHSAVGRDIIPPILERLGAEVIRVERAASFVAVDTEAVENPEHLAELVQEHGAEALVSTDGDSDRPLVVDEKGKMVRGDVLGILVASFLGADAVCVPISCNTAVDLCGRFKSVKKTRIGSPYVIEAMNQAVEEGFRRVVGYEANGGFLTATPMEKDGCRGTLQPLPTRDAVLPILAVLMDGAKKGSISALTAELPERYTYSGLIRHFPTELGREIVERVRRAGEPFVKELFDDTFGEVASLDFTDGARISFENGDIVHLRPSGNAPEFRCYTESSSEEKAVENNHKALDAIRRRFSPERGE